MTQQQQPGNLLSAAAVVTSQRLLIVGPDLTILASTPQRSGGAFITSALWVGPALLYCDSANAVRVLLLLVPLGLGFFTSFDKFT